MDNGDMMELIKARFDLARINRERFVFFTPQEREHVMDWLNQQQEEIERLQPKVAKWVSVWDQNIEFKRCTCCDYLCMGWDGETGVKYDYCPNCGAKMD